MCVREIGGGVHRADGLRGLAATQAGQAKQDIGQAGQASQATGHRPRPERQVPMPYDPLREVYIGAAGAVFVTQQ